MKALYLTVPVAIFGLLVFGCEKSTNPVETPPAEQSEVNSLAKVEVNETLDIEQDVFVPCAAGGVGETVHLSGSLHMLIHTTFDGNGGFHVKIQMQSQGVDGVGITTGDKYRGTSVDQRHYATGKIGFQESFVVNFRLIGQGPGNNLLVHDTIHYTINANGDPTAVVTNGSVECK